MKTKATNDIISNPNILGGSPVIYGTRIPVSRILYLLSLGNTVSGIQKEYPQLSLKQIKEVIAAIAKKAEEGVFLNP